MQHPRTSALTPTCCRLDRHLCVRIIITTQAAAATTCTAVITHTAAAAPALPPRNAISRRHKLRDLLRGIASCIKHLLS